MHKRSKSIEKKLKIMKQDLHELEIDIIILKLKEESKSIEENDMKSWSLIVVTNYILKNLKNIIVLIPLMSMNNFLNNR